jgi:hypothetical protein
MEAKPLFHVAYGEVLKILPSPIVRVYDVQQERLWNGQAQIRRGSSMLARSICTFFRLPPNGDEVPLTVAMRREGTSETWTRNFGRHSMTSRLSPGADAETVEETIWPLTGISRLDGDAEGVSQVLVGMRALGLALPKAFWPRVTVREVADEDRYLFSITIALPWGMPVIHYNGWLAAPQV